MYLWNSSIAKHCDLSMSLRSIIWLSRCFGEIIYLLTPDKSQLYLAQYCPILQYQISRLKLLIQIYIVRKIVQIQQCALLYVVNQTANFFVFSQPPKCITFLEKWRFCRCKCYMLLVSSLCTSCIRLQLSLPGYRPNVPVSHPNPVWVTFFVLAHNFHFWGKCLEYLQMHFCGWIGRVLLLAQGCH